mgnify:CR=1 FL=1
MARDCATSFARERFFALSTTRGPLRRFHCIGVLTEASVRHTAVARRLRCQSERNPRERERGGARRIHKRPLCDFSCIFGEVRTTVYSYVTPRFLALSPGEDEGT